MKRTFLSTLILGLSSTTSWAQNAIIFGDSLSDIGQNNWEAQGGKTHYVATYLNANGKPHKLYDQYLDPALKASSKGGRDYAYSGGVIWSDPSNTRKKENPDIPAQLLKNQVALYLKDGVDTKATHVMWAGGNDLSAMLQQLAQTKGDDAQKLSFLQNQVGMRAKEISILLGQLHNNGINSIILPTAPDISLTPAFFDTFGKVVGETLQKESTKFFIPLLRANFFNKVYTEVTSSVLKSPITSPQTVQGLKIEALQKAATKYYDGLYGWQQTLLNSKFKTREGFTAYLVEQYKKLLIASQTATKLLNNAVTKAANGTMDSNVVRIDTNALLNDMVTHPQQYGIKQLTLPACAMSPVFEAGGCKPTVSDPDSYLFADSFHPGPRAHHAMADYIRNVITIPKEVGALPTLWLGQVAHSLDFLRLHNINDRSTQSGLKVWLGRDVLHHGYMSHLNTTFQFNPRWSWQLQLSQGKQSNNAGNTQILQKNLFVQTALRYDTKNYWLGALTGYGRGHATLDRDSRIGLSHHWQHSNTDLTGMNAGLFAGYEWDINPIVFTFFGDVTYRRAIISGFHTSDDPLLKMYFQERHQNSVISGLGLNTKWNIGAFAPYAGARITREWLTAQRDVKTAFNGSTFTTKLNAVHPYTWQWQAGLSFTPEQMPFSADIGVVRTLKQADRPQNTTITFKAKLAF